MSTGIYDKTTKGRTEIATREFQLPSKLRPLLLMIDGKRSVAELLKQIQGLGLTQEHIDYLIDEGFIIELAEFVAPVEPSNNTSNTSNTAPEHNPSALPGALPETEAAATKPPAGATFMDDAKRLQALHNFFNNTIKSTLGLRGFTLQLKSERAATLQDFEALRRPYVEAVNKAKGREMAISLRDRLDQLLLNETGQSRDPILSDE